MKYKIYQEVLITRTVVVEDMEKDDWEGLDEAADQMGTEEWSVTNEDVKEQQIGMKTILGLRSNL